MIYIYIYINISFVNRKKGPDIKGLFGIFGARSWCEWNGFCVCVCVWIQFVGKVGLRGISLVKDDIEF